MALFGDNNIIFASAYSFSTQHSRASSSWYGLWSTSYTPKSSSSEVWAIGGISILAENSNEGDHRMTMGSNTGQVIDHACNAGSLNGWCQFHTANAWYLGTTGSTSSRTITLDVRANGSNTCYWNYDGSYSYVLLFEVENV